MDNCSRFLNRNWMLLYFHLSATASDANKQKQFKHIAKATIPKYLPWYWIYYTWSKTLLVENVFTLTPALTLTLTLKLTLTLTLTLTLKRNYVFGLTKWRHFLIKCPWYINLWYCVYCSKNALICCTVYANIKKNL